ncbi:MAG: SRPBCC domain-containing protein [Bacteroidota bacterium]
METKSIRQSVVFNASPMELYDLLMDENKHSAFTGGKVSMNKIIRGEFTIYDDYIHGYNVQLVEGEKIVQAWHFNEEGWPSNHFSFCTFKFKIVGIKTILSFIQRNVPAHKYDEIKAGWRQYYWNPMKKYLKTH